MAWKLDYGDGSTFYSTQGTPEDAPGHAVVLIIQSSVMMGREILNRWPCYYWAGVEWRGSTFAGVFDRLLAGLPVVAYSEGVILSNADLRVKWQAAFAEDIADIPEKTARSGSESPYNRETDYMINAIVDARTVERQIVPR